MGCGWLGLPLAKRLVKEGILVHGSTTSKEKIKVLEDAGIVPFQISLAEDGISGAMEAFLAEIDSLIINVPPKLRSGGRENYVKKMQLLHSAIKKAKIQNVLFVSSTSVYGDIEGTVTEETVPKPVTESGKQLLASENIFRNDITLQTTVIRFGGLIGSERHPVKMLSGRQGLKNGNHPINLIHLNDCIEIIFAIVQNGWWNEIFNGVYPHHPKKNDYYLSEAKKRGLQVPDFKEDNTKKGKIVEANRLIFVKKYVFTTTL